MPWIQNVGRVEIKAAHHYDPGPNSMCIQIINPGSEFPAVKYPFKTIKQTSFYDVEDDNFEPPITEAQAKYLAEALLEAKDNNMNIIVHCEAGICRSGAVVEAALKLGYQETDTFRLPNRLVKQLVSQELDNLMAERANQGEKS